MKFTSLLVLAIGIAAFPTQEVFADACAAGSTMEKFGIKKATKSFDVKISDLEPQYADYNLTTDAMSKQAMAADAYVTGLKKAFPTTWPTLIATMVGAVVTVTYEDGSKESFVHVGGYPSDIENYAIPGTQYDSSGKAICPSNNNPPSGSGGGGGEGDGGSGTGGGTTITLLPGGGDCYKTTTYYPDGSTTVGVDCTG